MAELPTLGRWAQVPPRELAQGELVDAVVEADRMMSRLHAIQAGLCAELARPGRAGDVTDLVDALTSKAGQATNPDGSINLDVLEVFVAEQAERLAAAAVGAALRISPMAAQGRVRDSVELTTELPATHQALTYGQIDRTKARIIADRTRMLTPDQRREVEEQVIDLAKDRAPSRLRTLVDRAAIKIDPDAAHQRHRRARSSREVTHRPEPDGMGTITAYLPAEGALSLFTLLNLIAAAKTTEDTRGIAERRADALTGIADQLLTHGHLALHPLLHPNTDAHENGGPSAANQNPEDTATDAATGADTDRDDGAGEAETGPIGVTTVDAHTDGEAAAAPNLVNTDTATINTDTDRDTDRDAATIDADDESEAEENAPVVHDSQESDRAAEPDQNPITPPAAQPAAPATTPRPKPPAPDKPGRTKKAAVGCPTCGHGTDTWLPSRQGRPVDLVLTMSLSTFAHLDQLPTHLAGHGAMTAQWAHTITTAARSVTLLVLDPKTGTALGAGTRTYVPRQTLRDQILTLNPTCQWTGCGQPSYNCELDHRNPYHRSATGCVDNCPHCGPTSIENLGPYCKWHHLLKTHAHWTPRRNANGTVTITSPTGHQHTELPFEFTLPEEWHQPTPYPDPPAQTTLIKWAHTYHQHIDRRINHDESKDNSGASSYDDPDLRMLPKAGQPSPPDDAPF